ncbi:hypothetical protein LUZ63_004765 [Rhynchospora breviuscula]|uniref:Protein EXORDIUM-like 2 n=1 Tax=Rhynchospora breviuscula TaxID=2022672 RepID=A0A9Q0HSG6_9POAL|nr:hypothetical protein LUZ63_004765 [Rhynchospora breviuscula]
MGINILHLLSLLLFPLVATAMIQHELFAVPAEPVILNYHNGTLLTGNYSINIIWYGDFTAAQRGIVIDFITSLSASTPAPSVASWWKTTSLYQGGGAQITLGSQYFDTNLSFGKSLTRKNLSQLATDNGHHKNAITAIFTSQNVLVEGFCLASCGIHRWATAGKHNGTKFAYLWAGNSATQCPGGCAWPFHKPIYGPQDPPLIPPNGDVGMDGLIIRIATLLAGIATNPYGDGYFLGDKLAPLEAVTACPGTFGTGYYPGYPGKLLIDETTGASYNADGLAGRKYLIPGMWNPVTKECTPLV